MDLEIETPENPVLYNLGHVTDLSRLRATDDNPSRLFSVIEGGFHSPGVDDVPLITFHDVAMPPWLSLEALFLLCPVERTIVHKAPPTSAGKRYLWMSSETGAKLDLNGAHVTFLSDPADLLISRTFAASSTSEGTLGARVAQRGGALGNEWDLILRRLESFLEGVEDCNFLVHAIAGLAGEVEGESAEAALHRASKVLEERFAFVGIVERLAESLFAMFDTFDWRQIAAFSAAACLVPTGLAPARDELPIRTRRNLDRVTLYDRMLYDTARERFENRFDESDFGDAFREFLRMPAFLPRAATRYLYGHNTGRVAAVKAVPRQDYVNSLEMLVEGLKAQKEQQQEAYRALLRQHLIATGVMSADSAA